MEGLDGTCGACAVPPLADAPCATLVPCFPGRASCGSAGLCEPLPATCGSDLHCEPPLTCYGGRTAPTNGCGT